LLKFESDLIFAPCHHGKMIAASHSLVNTCQVLGGRVIERSGGAVCGLYHARGDEKRGFLG
jgi:hypothetical protein